MCKFDNELSLAECAVIDVRNVSSGCESTRNIDAEKDTTLVQSRSELDQGVKSETGLTWLIQTFLR